MKDKPIILPPETQRAISAFFLKTSVPRIIAAGDYEEVKTNEASRRLGDRLAR